MTGHSKLIFEVERQLRYTLHMRRRIASLALGVMLGAAVSFATDPRIVDGVSGAPITWSDWVAKRAPVAILVWASWAPSARETMSQYQQYADASAAAGLHLVVLDVQETLEDGRAALRGRNVSWLHDRHGGLLKRYRIIKVPSIVLVAADGEPIDRLDPNPAAIRAWSGS